MYPIRRNESVFHGKKARGKTRGRREDAVWTNAVDLLKIRTGRRQQGTEKFGGRSSGRYLLTYSMEQSPS